MHPTLLDAAGHHRAAVTLPGYHAGRTPRNKGRRYPADPPTVEEIIAVMRTAGAGSDGARLRALIVVLWRAGLRISEALALTETDMDARRGAVRDCPRNCVGLSERDRHAYDYEKQDHEGQDHDRAGAARRGA